MYYLLDLDGVVIEFRFEQDVWGNRVPERVAKLKGWDIMEAKKYCFQKYESYKGTLLWSNVDHWSQIFGFEIREFYKDAGVYPDAVRLLDRIEAGGHVPVVVTASFPSINEIKLSPEGVKGRFKHIFCTHEFGTTKEDPAFFERVLKELGARPDECVFVDDAVLNVISARKVGIESFWLWRTEEKNQIEMNDLRKYKHEKHITSLDELLA